MLVFTHKVILQFTKITRAAQISWATVNQWLTNVGQRSAN